MLLTPKLPAQPQYVQLAPQRVQQLQYQLPQTQVCLHTHLLGYKLPC